MLKRLLVCVLLLSIGSCGQRHEPVLRLAVDAGFQPAMEALRAQFEAGCGCRLQITAGASGLLYGQIRAGEHFDVFLSADSARPVLLEKAGFIVPSSRQDYARGQLALWISRRLSSYNASDSSPGTVSDEADDEESELSALLAKLAGSDQVLTPRQLILLLGLGKHKLVLADPQLAPDGDAAVRMLKKLRLWPRLRGRVVFAGHAGHAQILLQQGAGEMGLIPYGQALASGSSGQFMRIPLHFHPPIHQQMVILRSTRERSLAIRLLQYMRSQAVQERLSALGFLAVELPETGT
ncbi:substrate-binding domain-containing protein [Microbulbifer pacificus]|uniref:Substrate-binding domain-containing protein n=1 Tax=Microbulbifer pacificus TaxID=407164 RepID=A0AAU0MWX8_9GAMM|nr:substrate-binding domain-containing protein [Microbulbifer pacificus]WOX04696.1 substrate-binding domain-containing protein [Microbulbifer pacificus]